MAFGSRAGDYEEEHLKPRFIAAQESKAQSRTMGDSVQPLQ